MQHGLQIMLVGRRICVGRERREKEGSEVFPHVRRAASHLLSFCTGCVQLRTGRDGADVSPGGGAPEP